LRYSANFVVVTFWNPPSTLRSLLSGTWFAFLLAGGPMEMSQKKTLCLVATALALFVFQNCGEAGFKIMPSNAKISRDLSEIQGLWSIDSTGVINTCQSSEDLYCAQWFSSEVPFLGYYTLQVSLSSPNKVDLSLGCFNYSGDVVLSENSFYQIKNLTMTSDNECSGDEVTESNIILQFFLDSQFQVSGDQINLQFINQNMMHMRLSRVALAYSVGF
jgi:hypothetical protein